MKGSYLYRDEVAMNLPLVTDPLLKEPRDLYILAFSQSVSGFGLILR